MHIIAAAQNCLWGGRGVQDCHGDQDSVRPARSKGACSFSEPIDSDDAWQRRPRVLMALVFVLHGSSGHPFWAFMSQNDTFSANAGQGFRGAG